MPKGRVIALPSVLGYEWAEGTTRYQLVVLRGGSTVGFGICRDGGRWAQTSVDSPERFGTIPTTVKEMAAYGAAFLAGDDNE